MDLPKSIRVGYRDYAVEPWSSVVASANGRLGECDRLNLIIRIRSDLNPMVTAEVLLHEVIHACYGNGVLEAEDSEERVTESLANQLAQVWRDNPHFVDFMSVALGRAR